MNFLFKIFILSVSTLACNIVYSTEMKSSLLNKNKEHIAKILKLDEIKLTPEYWKKQSRNKDTLVMSTAEVAHFNQEQFTRKNYLIDPLSYPDKLSAAQISEAILAVSHPSQPPRFYTNGKLLNTDDYKKFDTNIDLISLKDQNPMHFALVTHRSPLRTYPTLRKVLNSSMNPDLDRFQETAVFPGEVLAVLHFSADKKWAFVQNYHYKSWVQVKDIALASRKQVTNFSHAKNRLVVTASTLKLPTQQAEGIVLDMGVSLPLVKTEENDTLSKTYIAELPTRNSQGKLKLKQIRFNKNKDVHVGYLPMTEANILKQAFKFLGEPFGLGHNFGVRDCSGLVGEIYKSFGLLLPRNTGQQSKDSAGWNQYYTQAHSPDQKQLALKTLEVGDLIFFNGHVALFLGNDETGQSFILHDLHEMHYLDPHGNNKIVKTNGVLITPLLGIKRTLQDIVSIKRIRPTYLLIEASEKVSNDKLPQ